MSYKILTLDDRNEWNRLLNLLPTNQQDIYFTPEYYSLYENYGDGEARCFVYELDGEIALYPFLLNSINELGYQLDNEFFDIQGAYGYNGVLSSNTTLKFRKSFFDHFEKFCLEKNIIAEFTRFHPLINNYEFSPSNMNVLYDRETVLIDLSVPDEELFPKIQRTTRKQIRRCYKRYEIKILKVEKDTSHLDDFLEIYWETMNRVNSINHLKFNKNYFKELFEIDGTMQYYAIHENKPIAAIISLMRGNYMHGHLGGALTQFLYLSPYSLLYWEMIKNARSKGIGKLHIGGGATTAKDDRLFEFKKHFSDLVTTFCIGKKIHNKNIYEIIVRQWKKKHPESYLTNRNMLLGYREIQDGK